MNTWIHSGRLACLLICFALAHRLLAADPPTTQSDKSNGDSQRLEFIGKQLSADEATITAINKALKLAGYHAADATDKAAGAAKGNEIMDRKGGAPVPWQEFYGRTAKSFIMHDPYGEYYQVPRPDQFNNIYKANNDQIAKAQADIDALGKKVDKLLAHRQELETDQSSLWAKIAFESIQNREISTQRPLYTDQLQATPSKTDDNRPDGARVSVMRAAALYMRTIDNADIKLADSLDTDQELAYTALRDTLREAQNRLSKSIGDFADTPGVDPAEVAQMKEIDGQTRQIQSICKDVCDAYRKAQDADAAGEGDEQRKLIFRGTLQDSLLSLAEAVGRLDESLMKMSEGWGIHGLAGRKNADEPIALISSPPQKRVAPPAAAVAPDQSANPASPPAISGTVDLLRRLNLATDLVYGDWSSEAGALACTTKKSYSRVEFDYQVPAEYTYRVVFHRISGNSSIGMVLVWGGRQFSLYYAGGNDTVIAFQKVNNDTKQTMVKSEHWLTNGQRYVAEVVVRHDSVKAFLDGKLITSCHFGDVVSQPDYAEMKHKDRLGLWSNYSSVVFESVQVIENP